MRQDLHLEKIHWVKITNPSQKEVIGIENECNIHPLIIRELIVPTIRPKLDGYHDHMYMVMHVPVFNVKDRKTYSREIDIVLTKDAMITVTYDDVLPLEEFWKTAHNPQETPTTIEAGMFFYRMMNHMLAFSLRQLDHIQENIDTLEDIMFEGHGDEIVKDIYIARRDIIDFRRTLNPQEENYIALIEKAPALFGEHLKPFFRNLKHQYTRVWDILDGHKEAIEELYETNESLVSSNINRTMKVFTVLAFITFVPNVFTNIFGMTIEDFPLSKNPNAFWIIMLMTVGSMAIMYIYFKIKKIL